MKNLSLFIFITRILYKGTRWHLIILSRICLFYPACRRRGGVLKCPRFCFFFLFYSACRRRGGVLKCPRFCFFCWFFFFGVESWAAAHGLYRCTVYRLLSEPMSTRLLNSISSRICRENTQFNMYTTTSKQQEVVHSNILIQNVL